MLVNTLHPLISAIRRTARNGSGAANPFLTSLLRSNSMSRPSPPRLAQTQQREFEELHRAVQELGPTEHAEAEWALHPDAPRPIPLEFEGNVNPVTGEEGGPKQEPVRRWGEDHGDWSLKGRVSDF
jgi:hypothetical protein